MNEREKGFCWKEEVGKRENSSGVRGSHINFYNDALSKSTDILKYTKAVIVCRRLCTNIRFMDSEIINF